MTRAKGSCLRCVRYEVLNVLGRKHLPANSINPKRFGLAGGKPVPKICGGSLTTEIGEWT